MATEANESSAASRKDDDSRKDDGGLSDSSSTSDSDGENSSEEAAAQKIEWLATTRARRSTAGNRMKAMLANEEPAAEDSDLELLFAEDEDDAGFTDVENDASDVQMDSSSDDEDQEEGGDDLEGEKELERQAREKRNAQRKRKANEAIPAKFRKKVRIEQPVADSASVSSAAPQQHKPRPKKKSERLSWLPTAADMPTRASERRTTKMSKEQLHQKMVQDEIRRKKQIAAMEKKAARLEAMKKPPMTQAERLAEAALVEKRNSKSLNRWEVAEKQREEERLKKIAALNSRKLDGPVVTFWSGIQELEEGQLKHVGKMVSIEEKAPRKKRQSAAAILAAKELENAKAAEASKPPSPTTAENPDGKPPVETAAGASEVKPAVSETATVDQTVPSESSEQPKIEQQPPPTIQEAPPPPHPPATQEAPAETSVEKPPESRANPGLMVPPPAPPASSDLKQPSPPVLAAPVLAPPILGVQSPITPTDLSTPNTKSNVLAPPNTAQTPASEAQAEPNPNTPLLSEPSQAVPATSSPVPRPTPPALATNTSLQPVQGPQTAKGPDTPQQPTPTEPPREGKVTKSCILLQNFDEDAIKDKQVQTQILFGRKMNRLAKPAHAALCVITNHPARYRDPKTGLPFYNAHAYKEIQRALRGDYKFSSLIGAYVGSTKYAARGVPDRFLDPAKPRSTPVKKPEEPGDGQKAGEVKQEDLTGEQNQPVMPLPVMESRLEPTLAPIPPAPAPVRKQKSTAARSRVNSPMSRAQPPQHQNHITGPVFTPSPPVNPTQIQARHPTPASGPVFAPPAPGPPQVQTQARNQAQSQSSVPVPVTTGAVFAPMLSGQQSHATSQPRPHIPVTGAVFAPIHGPPAASAQPQVPAPASGPAFVPHAPKQGYTPLPSPGPGFLPPPIPGQAQAPTRSPAPTTGAIFAPPAPAPGQSLPASLPQGPISRDASNPPPTHPGQVHAPAPVKGPVFAPLAQGQGQSQPQSQHHPHPHPHHRPHAHVPPPPALPGSAEEAIASVRSNRISTPPVPVPLPVPTAHQNQNPNPGS